MVNMGCLTVGKRLYPMLRSLQLMGFSARNSLAIPALALLVLPSLEHPGVILHRRNAVNQIWLFLVLTVMYVHLPCKSLLRCSWSCYWSHLPISTRWIIHKSAVSKRISISLRDFSSIYFLLKECWVQQRDFSLLPPWMVCRGHACGTVLVCDLSQVEMTFLSLHRQKFRKVSAC